MPKVLRSAGDEVPRCEKCEWEFVAVYIKGKCVMLSKCKVCREFGQAYCLTPEPLVGSTVIHQNEVPADIKEYLETLIERIENYPSC